MNTQEATQLIRTLALQEGFAACGIGKAEFLEAEAPKLESWLKNKRQGEMKYMENHFDMRLDPRILVPGAKSVVSLLFNYYTDQKQSDPSAPEISKYAFGEDYHFVLKDKLHNIFKVIQDKIGRIEGRIFVDSAPILERAWATKTGLGWIGKNANLINKNSGSYFFLCEMIIDLELEYDSPFKTDHCGTCTACIDACPTEAILPGKVVDGSKCIAYYTIELKGELPQGKAKAFNNKMFGCDICQEVCPWNRFSKLHQEPRFLPKDELLNMSKSEWIALDIDQFNRMFKKSAVKRAGYNGLKRNIVFLSNT